MDKGLVQQASAWKLQQGLYQYTLVIQPGAEVCNKVVSEKQWLYEQLLLKPAGDTQPHIVIASFFAREDMEETIIRYMHRVCSRQQAFSIALNNFSGYPPHTIYLRVQDHQPFNQLWSELQSINQYIMSCRCPGITLSNHPQLSIASKVPESIYTKALMAYAQKTFHETFIAQELVLLRRQHQYDSSKVVNIFRLQPAGHTIVN